MERASCALCCVPFVYLCARLQLVLVLCCQLVRLGTFQINECACPVCPAVWLCAPLRFRLHTAINESIPCSLGVCCLVWSFCSIFLCTWCRGCTVHVKHSYLNRAVPTLPPTFHKRSSTHTGCASLRAMAASSVVAVASVSSAIVAVVVAVPFAVAAAFVVLLPAPRAQRTCSIRQQAALGRAGQPKQRAPPMPCRREL